MTEGLAWMCLMIAGACEIGFTTSMKLIDGSPIKNWPWCVAFLICCIASFGFMNLAMTKIPLGTVYAIWTGVGAAGTAVVGILMFGDPLTFLRGFFLVLLMGSVIGLHWAS